MDTQTLRREAKRKLDSLSADCLKAANDFLAYLGERESNEATEKLLRIPGFLEAFETAQKEIADGELTPAENLKRKLYIAS